MNVIQAWVRLVHEYIKVIGMSSGSPPQLLPAAGR